MNDILRIFAFIGISAVVAMIVIFLWILWDYVKDQIRLAEYRYKRKHRFDKKPIAKCYCKDCIFYNSFDGFCCLLKRAVPDDGYCYESQPHKYDPEKKEDQ